MKTILTSLLFAVSLFAGAATQTDVTYPAPAQFELQSGGVKLSTHASLAEAIAAATAKGAGTYSVVQPTATIVVTVTADPTPPAPEPTPPPVTTGPTYYLAVNGSDTAAGTAAAPWKTFAKAWTVLKAGDTLVVGDGTYTGTVQPPAGKSGAAGAEIVVRAANPGAAKLPPMLFKGNAYITVQGFRVLGTSSAIGIASNGKGLQSHHLTFREIGFDCTPGTLNDGACFGLGDGTHHVLLEDSWGWGGGRYTILCYGGPGGNPPNLGCDDNTFRRVVIRMGPAKSSSGNPQAALGLYYASRNLVENFVALDGVPASNSSNAAIYITGHAPPPNADGNRFFGVVAVNHKGAGLYVDCPGAVCNGTEVRDSVFWATQGGVSLGGGTGAGDSCKSVVVDHVTVGRSSLAGYDAYACTAALTNSALYANQFGAYQANAGTTTAHHVGYFGNVQGARNNIAAGAGDLASDPGFVSALRIEAGSPYKGAGSSGDIGANVVNRYVDGVLTATALFPWPNEARIKAEMCASVTTGFCASISLSAYLASFK